MVTYDPHKLLIKQNRQETPNNSPSPSPPHPQTHTHMDTTYTSHTQSGSVNIRIVVMNNLLPSSVQYHEKYDLKGSSYKRKAGPNEVTKKSPTFKDLDFVERHEEVCMSIYTLVLLLYLCVNPLGCVFETL